MISIMALKPARTVASVVAARYSSGDWAVAAVRMEVDLSVKSTRGMIDRVDGSCLLVQGPDHNISQRNSVMVSLILSGSIGVIFGPAFVIVDGIKEEV
jgi:hypothetical protein